MRSALLLSSLLLMLMVTACGGPDTESPGELVVYSGRNERLIGPLLDRFTEQTGIVVSRRYGGTSELTATLLEEGDATPADLFLSQDAAALGALSGAGLLQPLPEELLAVVPSNFRSSAGDWIGLSGRARVIVYNTELIDPMALPGILDEVMDERFRGKFGVAPGNASFQAHIAVYLAIHGEAKTRDLLMGMTANEPIRYPKNSAIVQAVITGEIEWGLVNHYYLLRALAENPGATALNYFMPGGGGSTYINMAGVGVLSQKPESMELVRFLIGEDAQRYFAEETFEYPLVSGLSFDSELPAVNDPDLVGLDYGRVAKSLEQALKLIDESGLALN